MAGTVGTPTLQHGQGRGTRRRRHEQPTPCCLTLRMLHSVARIAGRDPGQFVGSELPGGDVLVRGPNAEAHYPAQAWLSRLCRHMYEGYFDMPDQPAKSGHAQ